MDGWFSAWAASMLAAAEKGIQAGQPSRVTRMLRGPQDSSAFEARMAEEERRMQDPNRHVLKIWG